MDQVIDDGHWDQFIGFLNNNNVATIIIASIIAERISELSRALIEYIVMPIINIDINGDNKKDIGAVEGLYISLFGIKLEIGKFIIVLLKFAIITYITFLLARQIMK